MSRGGLRLYVQDGSFSGFCPQAVTVARQRPIFTALSGDQPIKKSNLLETLRRINKKPKEPWLCTSLSDLNGEHRHVVVLGGVTDKAEDVGFDVVEQI